MTADSMSYIGRCKGCGRIVAAVLDNPDHAKSVAKDVASFIRDGLIVERVESQVVRDLFQSCACRRKPESDQLSLFEDDQ